MRRQLFQMLFACVFAIGTTVLFANIGEELEGPLLVARTEEPRNLGAIVEEFENFPMIVGGKEDQLPIIGESVKTEVIVIPVDVIPYDDVVRTTRGVPSRKEFQDRWSE